MTFNFFRLFCYLIFLVIVLLSLPSCKSYNRNRSYSGVPISNISAGEKLSQQFCSQCHMFPDPSLLDSKSWANGVLPQMGPRLGIFENGFTSYPSYKNDKNLPASIYPSRPLLNFSEWQHIIDFYTATSPDTLQQVVPKNVKEVNDLFEVITPNAYFSNGATTFIKIPDTSYSSRLIICDATKNINYLFDRAINATDSFKTGSPVVDIFIDKDQLLLCNIGILNPNNGSSGSIVSHNLNNRSDSSTLIKNLQRPVQVLPADLNKDGEMDYLVCEFGFLPGALSWMEGNDSGNYIRHIIRPFPGAIKAYLNDVNNDGLPDIWVLFSQGEEGVFLFLNRGNGEFGSEQILRFPPSYGSSYFELTDFNNDGFADILYTCGDNADYSQILKPYHGVYIFLNDKSNHFNQTFFYHINGCYKAIARDFDGDKDLDIGCISFFPDLTHHPNEGFVYLENIGRNKFEPYSVTGIPKGRWLTMDAGDFDKDGKPDIALGSFNRPGSKSTEGLSQPKPSFIILKNKSGAR